MLDNCEHLLDACAALAEALLRACPGVRVLATSREPLGIAGEVAWRVPSLAAARPAAARRRSTQLAAVEAVRLFVERARAVAARLRRHRPRTRRRWPRSAGGWTASRWRSSWRRRGVTALTVEQIAARLDDRFRLLTGGSRTALPRQQTLRATLDWSYDLLTEPERALLPAAGGLRRRLDAGGGRGGRRRRRHRRRRRCSTC